VGLFVHVPFCAVSVSPTRGVPVIVGGDVLVGGAATAGAAHTQNAPIIVPAANRIRVVFTAILSSGLRFENGKTCLADAPALRTLYGCFREREKGIRSSTVARRME
jgi:hypothetical protein